MYLQPLDASSLDLSELSQGHFDLSIAYAGFVDKAQQIKTDKQGILKSTVSLDFINDLGLLPCTGKQSSHCIIENHQAMFVR